MASIKMLWIAILCVAAEAATINLSEDDQSAIKQTALNYANGWYNGNRDQMASALHDKLAKRAYLKTKSGERELDEMGKTVLVDAVKPGNAQYYASKPKKAEVEILDGFAHAATVKLQMDGWVDYLHIVRTENNEWKIINVLWEVNAK
jgi:hypothetical protein